MFSGINGVKIVADLRFCKGGLGVPSEKHHLWELGFMDSILAKEVLDCSVYMR
jgi:hypothetical protein